MRAAQSRAGHQARSQVGMEEEELLAGLGASPGSIGDIYNLSSTTIVNEEGRNCRLWEEEAFKRLQYNPHPKVGLTYATWRRCGLHRLRNDGLAPRNSTHS